VLLISPPSDDGGTERPERGAGSAEGVWSGRGGAIAPPQYGVWGYALGKKILKKSTLKSHIFCILQAEKMRSVSKAFS